MPYGQVISPVAVPTLPGTYEIITSQALPPVPGQGVVAAVASGTFGPAATATSTSNIVKQMFSVNDAARYFGAGSNMVNIVRQALLGGAVAVLGVRPGPGTGGATASKILQDTAGTPANAVTLTALYNGAAPLLVTIRSNPADGGATYQAMLYMDGTLWEVFTFVNSVSNTGVVNANNLINAINNGSTSGNGQTTPSQLVSAAIVGGYAGAAGIVLASVTQVAFTGGTNPTLTSTDYANALAAAVLEPVSWNVLAIDSESPTQHAAAQAQMDQYITDGFRRLAVFGQSTSVAFATSLTDPTTLNSPECIYVVNGFTSAAGFAAGSTPQNVQGYQAAARIAGIVASMRPGHTLTLRPIPDAAVAPGNTSAILEELTQAQQLQAVNAGATYFVRNASGQVCTGKGITTLTNPGTPPPWALSLDTPGWQKVRRVRTRFSLLDDIYSAWDAIMTNPDPRLRPTNNSQGWKMLTSVAQGVVNQYIVNNALASGTVAVDPTRTPTSDYAYFVINNLVDLDGIEEAVLTASFGGN